MSVIQGSLSNYVISKEHINSLASSQIVSKYRNKNDPLNKIEF